VTITSQQIIALANMYWAGYRHPGSSFDVQTHDRVAFRAVEQSGSTRLQALEAGYDTD
jgi:hypothetical protein